MSMWKIFVLVFFAALASYFLRGSAWLSRVSFLSNGATSGAIAWTAAYTFSHRVRWKAIASYFAVILGIIALDMTLGWLMGAWSSDPFARMRYTTIFTVGLSTSPLATFALLRAYGYRVET